MDVLACGVGHGLDKELRIAFPDGPWVILLYYSSPPKPYSNLYGPYRVP